ncbi:MAG TPA: hypothetical protein DCS89_12165 [Gammaproteobacteria bacterium]|nr:hypothetical protein [Gammaproteobacteria bacterium]HAT27764.1 hypothetical protein [Gammaproteobacteria bacterium]
MGLAIIPGFRSELGELYALKTANSLSLAIKRDRDTWDNKLIFYPFFKYEESHHRWLIIFLDRIIALSKQCEANSDHSPVLERIECLHNIWIPTVSMRQ